MIKKTSTSEDGLDMSNLDSITDEELQAFRDHYVYTKGYSIPAFEFWLKFRADILKRYRATVPFMTTSAEKKCIVKNSLNMLHYYAIQGYEDGILYEIHLSKRRGATKGEVLDTLAVAFLHSGPLGARFVASSSTEFMEQWQDEDASLEADERWPQDWAFDAAAFSSGMDFSRPGATRQDLDSLFAWYVDTIGEVPAYVKTLAELRPDFLKAYRNRFENLLRGGLPKQMLPYLLLHYCIERGHEDGIRENVLLCKAMGMTREQLIDGVVWSTVYAGIEAAGKVDRIAGDVIRGMPGAVTSAPIKTR